MNILVVDIGGTHIKFRTQKHRVPVKFDSGPKMTPKMMMAQLLEATSDWDYERVSLGFPAPVIHNRILHEPYNLGSGWVKFDFEQAFSGKPTRIVNDAALQALGSYRKGRMLFLGLGTGLGSAMVADGIVQPMELAHLPWKKGRTYEDYLGAAGLKRHGKKKWTKNVVEVTDSLRQALEADSIVLGGGNAPLVDPLPKGATLGANENAFKGGFLLWKSDKGFS
ncbi:polyphosphate glucokinase [Bryocella elongata]|uniref:Polyphosphate glucokinase n=1 Tax=Bryocella elongata TaxID=863522 RepID=A0A1H5ZJH5_9BACT|nr:ROK family protein [Bryocella elongata]SEG36599.1 polyphosphate glucokinase [Bryocella elongata]